MNLTRIFKCLGDAHIRRVGIVMTLERNMCHDICNLKPILTIRLTLLLSHLELVKCCLDIPKVVAYRL